MDNTNKHLVKLQEHQDYKRASDSILFWGSLVLGTIILNLLFAHDVFYVAMGICLYCMGVQLGVIVQIKRHEEYKENTNDP